LFASSRIGSSDPDLRIDSRISLAMWKDPRSVMEYRTTTTLAELGDAQS
jgi:hypothetical protein